MILKDGMYYDNLEIMSQTRNPQANKPHNTYLQLQCLEHQIQQTLSHSVIT